MPDATPRASKLRVPAAIGRLFWPLLALALLLLFNVVFTPGYLQIEVVNGRLSGYLIDIFRDGSAVMLVALGMTLVIATGGVDLSVGAIMAIAAVVSASMVTPEWLESALGPGAVSMLGGQTGLWIGIVITASLVAGLIAGVFNGTLVSVFGVQPIIATLILMVAGRGVAQLICGGQIFTYQQPGLEYLGKGTLLGLPFSLWLVAFAALAMVLLTRMTSLGLMIESVGDNARASRFTGLRSRSIQFVVYVVSGGCAALAGLIESSNVSSANANKIGLWFELDAIFAVVVGGAALTGGRYFIAGSLLGAVLIQTLTNTMYAQQVRPEIALIPKALVIIAVCLLQSPAFRRRVFGRFARKTRVAAAPPAAGGAAS